MQVCNVRTQRIGFAEAFKLSKGLLEISACIMDAVLVSNGFVQGPTAACCRMQPEHENRGCIKASLKLPSNAGSIEWTHTTHL